jgi:hypothetical protein
MIAESIMANNYPKFHGIDYHKKRETAIILQKIRECFPIGMLLLLEEIQPQFAHKHKSTN